MASQFSELYKQSAAIHEIIRECMSRARLGEGLDPIEITIRVREAYPDVGMVPMDLAKAIMQAADVLGVQLKDGVSERLQRSGSTIST